jgi:hypothetical protein
MTTLLTARCQNFAPPFGLHSSAEAMGLMAPAHFGLKRAFGQRYSSKQAPVPSPTAPTKGLPSLNPSRLTNKTFSVSDQLRPVKACAGIGDRPFQKRTPTQRASLRSKRFPESSTARAQSGSSGSALRKTHESPVSFLTSESF